MSRPQWARALAVALALGASACQDYNFNPVGHCLIATGNRSFTLSNISTADVLFVVDDSNSMAGEQQELADNFQTFIDTLTDTNAGRQAAGLQPIDFHIAITTSSLYYNRENGSVCSTTCGSATGTAVCCASNAPLRKVRACTTDADCGTGNGTCRTDCKDNLGALTCCVDGSSAPPTPDWVTCSRIGTACGGLETHYDFSSVPGGCASTIANDGWPFPDGDFVSSADWVNYSGTPNPKVLHFDKSLYTGAGVNSQGFTIDQLKTFFQQNVKVGTCGSAQEQHLQAARRAIDKAVGGGQWDTRNATNGQVAWTAPSASRLPGGVRAGWPNGNSKLVVVFVGDEDDCSSPQNPSGGVVMLNTESSGHDACTRDASTPEPLGQKEYPVSDFVTYLTNLGRPVAAGFILPAAQTACRLEANASYPACTTAGLCCPATGCTYTDGAQAPGTRMLALAHGLESAGVDVVAGSICDPSFGDILNDIAQIVKPPETLQLPAVPAEGRITILRIKGTDGNARLCGAALAPELAVSTLAAAKSSAADWWFVPSNQPGPPAFDQVVPGFDPSICGSRSVPCPTKYIYINPNGSCKANPGETYSADFIGVSPAASPSNPNGGCVQTAGDPTGSLDCQTKLGGPTGSYDCFIPPGLTRGTCTCKSGQ
jgi:hypothetical protein